MTRPVPLARLAALALVAFFSTVSSLHAHSPALQPLVDRAAQNALEKYAPQKLLPTPLAITLVDLSSFPSPPSSASSKSSADSAPRASYRGDVQIYPASVIKLFYLAAAHRWMEAGKLNDTPELRRAMKDMIVDSSNDATHYVIDVITGTHSGPELPDADIKTWFDRRNAVTHYFASLGYTGVFAHKKPWSDGPYGRESQAIRLFEPKRNLLTSDATARLFTEIATGQCVTAARSAEMMTLLARDLVTKDPDPDNQATFTGPVLPAGAKLWSKAGWTSQTRHDAAYIELPHGPKFLLVVFTTDHAHERTIIHTVAKVLVDAFAK